MTSRQYRWQLKKRALGLCTKCGKPVSKTNESFCEFHRQWFNQWKMKRINKELGQIADLMTKAIYSKKSRKDTWNELTAKAGKTDFIE
mgnify:CR=1 FL=1